jgi:hypothetical protein
MLAMYNRRIGKGPSRRKDKDYKTPRSIGRPAFPLNGHIIRQAQPLELLVRQRQLCLIDIVLVIQRLVPMNPRRATAPSPPIRQDVDNLPHPTMQQRHRAHDARLVRREQREGGEEIVCSVAGWDLVGERGERPELGDGGDAVEGGVAEGMRGGEPGVVSGGADEGGRRDGGVVGWENRGRWRRDMDAYR